MPLNEMPPAEVAVSLELVRSLLDEQRPDLADQSVELLAEGWDNVSFRIGDELVARLPRRQIAADLLANEQRWLPELAPLLPLPIPVPRFVGAAGHGYPWSWSICDRLPGVTAAEAPLGNSASAAIVLGSFLGALHHSAPREAPHNRVRGGPLYERDPVLRTRLDQISDLPWLDEESALSIWEQAVAAPVFAETPVWVHGDLHPHNVLVAEGAISAVIDFGDLTAGDPATDLAIAWMMFDEADHPRLKSGHGGVGDATWERARGWALHLAVSFVAASADNAVMGAIGRATLERLLGIGSNRAKP